jgi:hypothetical protein
MKIEHQIGIAAPAEVIWAVISDLPSWSEWNPLYPEAKGVIGFGELLTLTVAIPGQERRVIQPRIVDWTPDEAIHWTLSAVGGLVKSIRYLEIETLGPTNCIFNNGEIFSGLLGPRAVKPMRRALRQGFTEMGEAVAARSEALWRERQGVAN